VPKRFSKRRRSLLRGLTDMPCLWSSFAQTPVVRFEYAVVPDEHGGGGCSPPAAIRKHEGEGYGESD
jgi:hypothetical protein